jgi:hypothetical protein
MGQTDGWFRDRNDADTFDFFFAQKYFIKGITLSGLKE